MISPLRIDVCALAWSAPASPSLHLVTRDTGRKVRAAIEGRLGQRAETGVSANSNGQSPDTLPPRLPDISTPQSPDASTGQSPDTSSPATAVVLLVDLTRVPVMDFSCADEVVAKLLLRYLAPDRPRDVFFLFRALADRHRHYLEQALERHELAAVCDMGGGRFQLVGCVSHDERTAWTAIESRGRMRPGDAAAVLGSRGERRLRRLAERRLVYAENCGAVSALSAFAANGDGAL